MLRAILQHLEAGQNNTKRQQPALLSIREVVKAGYNSPSVCELGCEFICRSLNLAQHREFLCMGSLCSTRKEVFDGEAERSRGKDKRSHSLQPWQCICSTSSSQLRQRLVHHLQLCRTPLGASHLLSLKFKSEQSVWDKVWISLKFCPHHLWVFGA